MNSQKNLTKECNSDVKKETKLHKFICLTCGGNELSYRKWVQSLADVSIKDDGFVEYGLDKVDETNELGACSAYVCRSCGTPLSFRADNMETEADLNFYLSLTPEEIKEADEEYLREQENEIPVEEDYQEEVICNE